MFRADRLLAVLLVALSTGCYSFTGGGGFPSEIRSIYIEPFENTTAQFDLGQQLFQQLQERLPSAFGVRLAGEDNADAIIRGSITRYDNASQPVGLDPTSTQPQLFTVQVGATVEIVDVRRNLILWESRSLVGRGEYQPASQQDLVGREIALQNIVQQIIDGAQQQW